MYFQYKNAASTFKDYKLGFYYKHQTFLMETPSFDENTSVGVKPDV